VPSKTAKKGPALGSQLEFRNCRKLSSSTKNRTLTKGGDSKKNRKRVNWGERKTIPLLGTLFGRARSLSKLSFTKSGVRARVEGTRGDAEKGDWGGKGRDSHEKTSSTLAIGYSEKAPRRGWKRKFQDQVTESTGRLGNGKFKGKAKQTEPSPISSIYRGILVVGKERGWRTHVEKARKGVMVWKQGGLKSALPAKCEGIKVALSKKKGKERRSTCLKRETGRRGGRDTSSQEKKRKRQGKKEEKDKNPKQPHIKGYDALEISCRQGGQRHMEKRSSCRKGRYWRETRGGVESGSCQTEGKNGMDFSYGAEAGKGPEQDCEASKRYPPENVPPGVETYWICELTDTSRVNFLHST